MKSGDKPTLAEENEEEEKEKEEEEKKEEEASCPKMLATSGKYFHLYTNRLKKVSISFTYSILKYDNIKCCCFLNSLRRKYSTRKMFSKRPSKS